MTDPQSFDPEQNPEASESFLSDSSLYISEPTLLSPDELEKNSDWLGNILLRVCDEIGLSKPEELIAVVANWAYAEKGAALDKELAQIQKVLDESVELGLMTNEEAIERFERKRNELQKPPLIDAFLNRKEQETLYTLLKTAQSEADNLTDDIRVLIKLFFGAE